MYRIHHENIASLIGLLRNSQNPEYIELIKYLTRLYWEDIDSIISGLLEPKVLSTLLLLYQNAEIPIRKILVFILGDIQEPEVLQALINTISNTKEEVDLRAFVASALADHQNPQVVELLIHMLDDPHPKIRSSCAHSLGSLKDKRAVEPLLILLHDNELGVRIVTVWALSSLEDAKTVEPMIKLLESEDESIEVKRGAANALERLKDESALPVIIKNLSSPDEYLRYSSIAALGSFGNIQILPILNEMLTKLPKKHKGQRLKKTITDAIAAIESRYTEPIQD